MILDEQTDRWGRLELLWVHDDQHGYKFRMIDPLAAPGAQHKWGFQTKNQMNLVKGAIELIRDWENNSYTLRSWYIPEGGVYHTYENHDHYPGIPNLIYR